MASRVRTRTTWMTRAWSALGVVLVVLAQTTSLLHDGAVRHARCAEHGELIELSTSSAALHARGPQDIVDTFVASSLDGGHEHDHCLLALHRATSAPRAPRIALPTPLFARSVARAVARASEQHTAIALLRMAPKTSPPSISIS